MDDLRSSRLVSEIQVGGNPDWQAAGFGAVWVSTGGSGNSVVRIDEKTNKVVATIAVNSPYLSLAAGFGSIWSPSCGDNALDRIDPVSNRVTARIPLAGLPSDGEGLLAVASGSVWLFTDEVGTLVRIDPATNKIAATDQLHGGGISIVGSTGKLWVTVPSDDTVREVDPSSGAERRTIGVGRSPRFEAAGEGGVWVLGQGDGDVTRIDPATGQVLVKVALEIPGSGGCIATGGGSVWVTMPRTPVSRVNAETNTVTEQFTGDGGDCIGFADGSVWLSNNALGSVWRIKP